MNWEVQLCELNYCGKEVDAVKEVLNNEWLTMGAVSAQFEQSFSDFHNHHSPGVFVSSATAGLHLILMSLEIGSGDEVIMPALTFVSDANVVRQLGATPVFADSESLTNLNVSSKDIIRRITNNTRAIVIVHFAGFPLDISDLSKICKEKGIFLIEDCAHAPGAMLGSRFCGTLGDFSFYSFFSNKNLAVGEGGMVLAQDTESLQKIRLLRSHGMSSVTLDRHLGRSSSYDVLTAGLNYRADEIRAAIGIVQLEKLKQGNAKRGILTEYYRKKFRGSQIIVPFDGIDAVLPAYHIMPILLPENINRNQLMETMKNKGIQTSVHYPSFSSFTAYRNTADFNQLKIANEICERELTLPLHPRLDYQDIDLVADTLLEIIN
jgi:dTDP-4-amino-4,6-dideoxygalactose transaminase